MVETGNIGRGGTSLIDLRSSRPLGPGLDAVMEAASRAARFGTATSDNGARMFGHVPFVAPQAWFHILFPPLDEAALGQLERSLMRPIPGPYRDLLRVTNGLHLFGGELALYGRRTDYSRKPEIRLPFDLTDPNVHERPRAADPSWFIFSFYQEDGSPAYMDPKDNRVYRGSRDLTRPRLNQWSSLDDYLEQEIGRMAPLFDERGRLRDDSIPTTPD